MKAQDPQKKKGTLMERYEEAGRALLIFLQFQPYPLKIRKKHNIQCILIRNTTTGPERMLRARGIGTYSVTGRGSP